MIWSHQAPPLTPCQQYLKHNTLSPPPPPKKKKNNNKKNKKQTNKKTLIHYPVLKNIQKEYKNILLTIIYVLC